MAFKVTFKYCTLEAPDAEFLTIQEARAYGASKGIPFTVLSGSNAVIAESDGDSDWRLFLQEGNGIV